MTASPTGPATLSALTHDDLVALVTGAGLVASHADRIARAALRGGVLALEDVPGLGARPTSALRDRLALRTTRVHARSTSPDGTVKLLVEGRHGDAYEAVLMPLDRRFSGCVSSQVGCAAACAFCASGLEGLRRSLAAEEIVEQVLHLDDAARARGARLSNLVFMGMGEPMHAYDAVVGALRRLLDPRLRAFAPGRTTVSTVGIVPGILALADEGLGVHLAVSLHAADDALRRTLLPVGGRHSVAEVLDAAETFRVRTRRFVTVQTTLLEDVNDGEEHAHALVRAIAGRPFHVNLIPVNPVEGTPWRRPSDARVEAFRRVLRERGVAVHVRRRRGADVDAACGQLRRRAHPSRVVAPGAGG